MTTEAKSRVESTEAGAATGPSSKPRLPLVLPPVDVFADERGLTIDAELPGVSADELQLEFERGVLTLSAERRMETSGRVLHRGLAPVHFHRRLTLPDGVDVEKISAEAKNGILRISVPYSEAQKKRTIAVRTA